MRKYQIYVRLKGVGSTKEEESHLLWAELDSVDGDVAILIYNALWLACFRRVRRSHLERNDYREKSDRADMLFDVHPKLLVDIRGCSTRHGHTGSIPGSSEEFLGIRDRHNQNKDTLQA